VASHGEGDGAALVFHETFPAVVSEKRPKAHGGMPPRKGMPVAVFFHPDCDRRLRHSTGSADLPAGPGALAGSLPEGNLPPVGNFAPPWRRC